MFAQTEKLSYSKKFLIEILLELLSLLNEVVKTMLKREDVFESLIVHF